MRFILQVPKGSRISSRQTFSHLASLTFAVREIILATRSSPEDTLIVIGAPGSRAGAMRVRAIRASGAGSPHSVIRPLSDPSASAATAPGVGCPPRQSCVQQLRHVSFAAEEYSEGLGSFDCLVLDEAHDADKELETFLQVELTVEEARASSTRSGSKGNSASTRGKAGPGSTKGCSRRVSKRVLEQQPPADHEGAIRSVAS